MDPCSRRRLLAKGGLGLVSTTMIAGCSDDLGMNATLVLRNEVSEPIEIDIQVKRFRQGAGTEAKTTFDDVVAIPAEDTKRLDILGNASFRITVIGFGQETTFQTKPTCNYAYTKVIVTDTREITKDVKFCE